MTDELATPADRATKPATASGMRLALMTNFVPPYLHAVYATLAEQCSGLRIFLSALTESNRVWEPAIAGLPVVVQRSISTRQWWRHPSGFTEAATLHVPYDTLPQLMRFKPDVIISGEMGARTILAWGYTLVHRRCRLVLWAKVSDVTERGRSWPRRVIRKFLVRRSDAVIVNGQAGARYVQRLGARPPRIFQIPYTTDLRPLVTLPIARPPHVRKRLLYCGALSERKGVRQFVEALARWAASHPSQTVKLDVVGHGPLSGFLETFHGPSNLELELRGAIHYSDLPDIYRHAGICVFPTLADEWGMVVTEAMAAGLPVMGSPYSQAVEELVRDRANGWTFRPDQSAEIDRALEQALMSSDQELEAMGRNARETVRPMTPAYVASQVMAVAALIREGGER